jgi:hypothetical protein
VELDIEAYAAAMAELASAGDARAAVLTRLGLDEERWDAIDTYWQDRLSEAMDADDDGVHPLVSIYAAAYEAAQRSLAPISLEQFAEVTRLLHASGDLQASLSRVGVTLAEYVRGSEHWSRRIPQDPELDRRFSEALRGR